MTKEVKIALGIVCLIAFVVGLAFAFSGSEKQQKILDLIQTSELGNNNSEHERKTGKDTCSPEFEEYAVQQRAYLAPVEVDVDYSSFPESNRFESEIEAAIKQGPNFAAGRYSVSEWGCGSSCENAAIVDLDTGDVIVLGLLSTVGFEYKVDSELFVVNPPSKILESSDRNIQTEYYKMGDSGLEYVCHHDSLPQEDQICAQVIVDAENPATRQELSFSNPCKVPNSNWVR